MKELIEQAAADADEVTIQEIERKDELPPDALSAIQQVELAHQNYELCTPAQRLWVLQNCPERLFLEYGIAERKIVQQGISDLHRYLALTVNIHDIHPTLQ